MPDRPTIAVTFDARGYVATGDDGLTVTALSLKMLRQRVGKQAKLKLDRAARAERDLRRAGGSRRAADARPR